MKNLYHSLKAKWSGQNTVDTPKDVIKDQLTTKHPLPTGITEFHEWADRIISGCGLAADRISLKYVLANEIATGCGPNVAFESDIYFIHRLRKYAANQVAQHVREELYNMRKAQAAIKQNSGEVTPPTGDDGKILSIARVPETQGGVGSKT